ncbi:MAG TPA: peroxidase-related enzyme [Chloroflexota bacterium]
MVWIQTVARDDAEGVLREAYEWQAASLGEVTEFTQLGSLYPELVMERLRLYKVVEAAPSSLTVLERRIAAYVTSMLNGTPHCASGLVHRLADMAVPTTIVESAAETPQALGSGDPRLDAVAAYAAQLTLQPAHVGEAEVERLREQGLDDLAILDLNNIVAYYNYINRVANGLGLKTEIPADHARHALPR